MYWNVFWIVRRPAAIRCYRHPSLRRIQSCCYSQGYIVGDNSSWTVCSWRVFLRCCSLWSTGGGDFKKGQFYNIGDRYGAQGLHKYEKLSDQMDHGGRFSVGRVLLLLSTLSLTLMVYSAILSFARGDSADSRFVPKTRWPGRILVRKISTVNSAWKVITALILVNGWVRMKVTSLMYPLQLHCGWGNNRVLPRKNNARHLHLRLISLRVKKSTEICFE